MIPIRGRTAPRALLPAVSILALTVSGCGLSAELDREVDPARTARPSEAAASLAETEPPDGVTPGAVPTDLGVDVPGAADSPPATSTGCPPSGIRIQPEAISAAMGLRAMSVTVTNCGTTTYDVYGYPDVQVLDEHREALDVQILEGTEPVTTGQPDPGPHPVSLKPGQSAHTVLVWRNTVTDTTTTAVSGTYLRFATALGRPAEIITPQGRIDLGNTGRIGTTAWARTP
ncbi:DUF4232 domain-containing protein [Streptomyces sp. NPDC002845]